jgi:hypothetical protein
MRSLRMFYVMVVKTISDFKNKWLNKRNDDDDLFDHPYAIL